MIIGKCKLCLQNKHLVKKSHIIPDFMYKTLKDDTHNNEFFSLPIHNVYDKEKKLYTGEYESNILCLNCENKLSKFENYAKSVIFGKTNVIFQNVKNQHGVEYIQCKNIDYKKFKLFLLSILWRASISSRNFFREVSLGPYEEKIRNMLLNNDPGQFNEIPCLILTYIKYPNIPNQLIVPPQKINRDNCIRYTFPIAGFFYTFFISKNNRPNYLSECVINNKNEMKIIYLLEWQGKKFIFDIINKIKK